jgi:hypothetical protein
MPIPYKLEITNAVGPTAITNAATIVWQATLTASKPIRLKRIELQSNQTGSTQTIIPLQLATWTTASGAGGVTPTPRAVDRGVTTAAVTAFRCLTATMPTTLLIVDDEWQWNGANPFDVVFGLTEMQHEYAVSSIVALTIPTASGTPSLTGALYYEEFG